MKLRAHILQVVTCCLLNSAICQGQRPDSGIRLFSSLSGNPVLNNSMLYPGASNLQGNLTYDHGLGCFTARLGFAHKGNWFFPNGEVVPRIPNHGGVLYTLDLNSNIELVDGNGSSFDSVELEGVYMCRILDEENMFQSMYAGLYKTENYFNSDGPLLPFPPSFHLLSSLTASSLSFSLTCTSTSFPPTTLTWSQNGQPLEELDLQFQSIQVLRDAGTTTYDNTVTVTGDDLTGVYRCKVSNDRGSREGEIAVRAPSGPPTAVTAAPVGNNQLQVQWVPPGNVSGYLILYRSNASGVEYSEIVSDPDAMGHVIRNVPVDQLNVRYTGTILAFAELLGERSEEFTVILSAVKPPTLMSVVPLSPTTIQVQWTPLEDTTVVGYKISYAPSTADCPEIEGGDLMVAGRTVSEAVLVGLQEFTEYNITVRSRNSIGAGPPSNVIMARTLADEPSGPPLSLSAEALGPTSLRMRWEPPNCVHLNSQRATSYIIQHGPAGASQLEETSVTTGLSRVLETLPTFTVYSVRVLAVNEEGRGPPSVMVEVALVDVPGAAESLSALPDITSVVVRWQQPLQANGWITNYTISYRLASSSTGDIIDSTDLDGSVTSHRVTGLPILQTQYAFTVKSYTVAGPGLSSSIWALATTKAIGQVTDVKVSSVNATAVRVSWTRLQSTDISFYRVTYSLAGSGGKGKRQTGGERLFPGESSSGVIGGLEEGKEYEYQVAAGVTVNGSEVFGPPAAVEDDDVESDEIAVGAIVGALLGSAVFIATVVVICVTIICLLWLKKKQKAAHSSDIAVKQCEAYMTSRFAMRECEAYETSVHTPVSSANIDPDYEIVN